MSSQNTENEIILVGAGPGAEDLITIRGAKALEEADLVVYAGSLVSLVHLKRCKASCQSHDSANMSLEEQVSVMAQGVREGKKVVRLHTGDPSMYGAINEQIRLLKKEGVTTRIVPGVSSVFAAAAALGCELTSPDISQTVVLTRTPGRTPMPVREKASTYAKTGATLVFFLSTANVQNLMENLMGDGELSADTPAAVVYRASWPDERILRGTISTIAQKVDEAGLGRQALIFVGKALDADGADSKLYDAKFSHGYRNTLESEHFSGKCALYAFTEKALVRAKEIATGLGVPTNIYTTRPQNAQSSDLKHDIIYLKKDDFKSELSKNWKNFDAHIFVSATGIAVRQIAPYLTCKTTDPAVLVCSENGAHILSLVSGHLGGANRLARRVARITQGQAIISTATDLNGLPSFDEVAAQMQARILNVEMLPALSSALLHNEKIAFLGSKEVYKQFFNDISCIEFVENSNNLKDLQVNHAILWDLENVEDFNAPTVKYVLKISSKIFALGMGCKKDADPNIFAEKLHTFLQAHNIQKEQIACMASCDVKKEEKAMLDIANSWNKKLHFYSAEELNLVEVPNPSDYVFQTLGTHSVCEAASLLGAGYKENNQINPNLIIQKESFDDCTFAISTLPHGRENILSTCDNDKKACVIVVGLGSGSDRHITPEVSKALEDCDTIAGYSNYIDMVKDRVAGKNLIKNGMMGEVERCQDTLRAAASGKCVCMVCSGDPGILAMAGLLFELREREEEFKGVEILVYPGITSANIAAASLGAPLQNGFSLISLSDLLVPSDEVRQNLKAVAKSALPVAMYNPAGKKRRELLGEAIEIFEAERGSEIWCATVRHAGRDEESTWVGKISDFPQESVDMSTLVIIGSHRTKYSSGVLYEARGYVDKYLKS